MGATKLKYIMRTDIKILITSLQFCHFAYSWLFPTRILTIFLALSLRVSNLFIFIQKLLPRFIHFNYLECDSNAARKAHQKKKKDGSAHQEYVRATEKHFINMTKKKNETIYTSYFSKLRINHLDSLSDIVVSIVDIFHLPN